MHLAERQHGDFRIYAAAIDAPDGSGFVAGVVVNKFPRASDGHDCVFRDDCLEEGKVWSSPEVALSFALEVGQAAIAAQRVVMGHGQHFKVSPKC